MQDYGTVLNLIWQYASVFIEIGLLTFLIYKSLYYLRGTRGSYVLAGLVIIIMTLTLLSGFLHFEVIKSLLEGFWTIIPIAVVVIFQPELRRAFAQLGSYTFWQRSRRREVIGELAGAAIDMAQRKCGSIIVVERRIRMQAIIEDSVKLDIKVNSMILESIFYPNSPLHDGAVIIRDDRIVAARAILPLTRVENAMLSWGTRHRAAVGITEETDAVVLVVSEETGIISVASRGLIRRRIPAELLESYLEGMLLREELDSELARELDLPERISTIEDDNPNLRLRKIVNSEEAQNDEL